MEEIPAADRAAKRGTPSLRITGLKKHFLSPDGNRRLVLDVPSFELGDGEHAALRGASGSGKTTFLHVIAGILRADEGSVKVAGTELTTLSEAALDRFRADAIGYVFQTFHLLRGYTALENVEMGMVFGRGADRKAARGLLARVGLEDRLDDRPAQLSVGQQQRVAVARALSNRPRLVLADEPTGNLDARRAFEALDLMREACRESKAALLVVSHDRDILARFERVEELAAINRAEQE